jgi:hypothetical protein
MQRRHLELTMQVNGISVVPADERQNLLGAVVRLQGDWMPSPKPPEAAQATAWR